MNLRNLSDFMKMKSEKEITECFKQKEHIWSKDDYSFEELFEGADGWKFAKQMKNLQGFTLKGIFGGSILEFSQFLPEFMKYFQSGKFEQEFEINKYLGSKEIEKLETLKNLFNEEIVSDEDYTFDLTLIVTEEEQVGFLSYLIIASCSYFEAFIEDLFSNLVNQLIKHHDNFKNQQIQVKQVIQEIHRKSHLNGFDRIRGLIKFIKQESYFKKLLKKIDMVSAHQIVYQIKELRNELVHEEPLPDLSIFEKEKYKQLKEYLEEGKQFEERELIKEFEKEKIPKGMKEILERLLKKIMKKIPFISIIQTLPEIILIYAALIEGYIIYSFKHNNK